MFHLNATCAVLRSRGHLDAILLQHTLLHTTS